MAESDQRSGDAGAKHRPAKRISSSTRLWLCTPHALRISEDDAPTAAYLQVLWGFGRTLSLESPLCFGGLVDLPENELGEGAAGGPALSRVAAMFLATEVHPEGNEFALRHHQLWTRRIYRAPARPELAFAATKWRPQGTILITGGTGALGSFLSHWLAERGAQHLILTSRRGEDAPGSAALVTALWDKGCRVELRACDMSDGVAVDALMRELSFAQEGRSTLRHIFHLAGVAMDVPLRELTAKTIEQEQSGKVGGAWALHDATIRYGVKVRVICFVWIDLWAARQLWPAGVQRCKRRADRFGALPTCEGTGGDGPSLGGVGRSWNCDHTGDRNSASSSGQSVHEARTLSVRSRASIRGASRRVGGL